MIIVVLTLLGLCFGSFVNALVWRMHEQAKPRKRRAASDAELSISRGRSMCPHCKHTLGVLDLLPVVSWLMLGGKCRYCRKSIGWQYPLVELLTAMLFAVSYVLWPWGWSFAGYVMLTAWLAGIVIFMALIIYDIRWMLLPNKLVFPLTGIAAVSCLAFVFASNDKLHAAGAAGLSVAIAGGVFYLLFLVSDGRWIGGGDVKLGWALGLFVVKPALALLVLFGACLIGTLYALPLMAIGKIKRTSRVPFGPFLILATIIVMLCGQRILDWYLHTMLLLPA